MNKNVWLTAAFMAIILLSACRGSKEEALQVSEAKKDGTFKIEAMDSGGGSVKLEGGQSELPPDFPKDIPILKGAKIQSSLKTTSDKGSGYVVTFTVDQSVEECSKYYRGFLDQKGYKTSELKAEQNVTLMGGNDIKSFFIGIMPDETDASRTLVTITYGDNGS